MAQTIEELAEILEGIKKEADRNAENTDKFLTVINNKIELMANDTETDDLIKVYLTELKKVLEDRYSFVTGEFENLEKALKSISDEQANLSKSSETKEMFDIFSSNMQSVAKELYNQKELLAQYDERLAAFAADKTDKNDIMEFVQNIRNDVEAVNKGFEESIADINANIQSIFKNLIVMDPTAQNDIVKRELENIYLSVNAILSSLHIVDQKNDELSQAIGKLVSKENYEQSQNKLNSLIEKTDNVSNELNSVVHKEDLENVIGKSTEILDKLDTMPLRDDLKYFAQKNDELAAQISSLPQKSDFDNITYQTNQISEKLDKTATSSDIEQINTKADRLEEQISSLPQQGDFADIYKAIHEFSEILDKLKDELKSSDESTSIAIREQLDKLNTVLSAVVTENDFTGFRHDLADFIQKIIDNSSSLNQNLDVNKQTLQELITKIESLDIHKDIYTVANALDGLRGSYDNLEQHLNENIVSLKELISSNVTVRDEKFANLDEKLSTYLTNTENIANDTAIKIGNSMSEINDLKTEIENISKELTNRDYSQDESNSKLISLITSELGELGVTLNTLQDNVQAGVHTELVKTSESVEAKMNELLTAFDEFKSENSEETLLETNFKEIKDRITALKQEINLINTDIIDVLNAKSEMLSNQIAQLKPAIDALAELESKIETSVGDKLESSVTEQNQKIDNAIVTIKALIDKKFESYSPADFVNKIASSITTMRDAVVQKIVENNATSVIEVNSQDIKDTLTDKINSNTEDLKTLMSVAMNNDDVIWAIDSLKDDISDKVTRIFNERNDFGTLLEKTSELSAKTDEVSVNFDEKTDKINELLDVISQKVDILAMSDGTEILQDDIEEVKELIENQKSLIESIDGTEKLNSIENNLQELLEKIQSLEPIDYSGDINEAKEKILEAIVNVFNQISFTEDAEDIKDFVEEKTDEINKNLKEVKNQLNQITSTEYSYTLEDVETDIAKLRLVLNEMSQNSSKDDFSEVSDDIKKIITSVEELQNSLTHDEINGLKDKFESLSEDILSISSRTNKILLTSDDSYNALCSNLNDFSNLIGQLDERLSYLDNKELTERIELKIDNALNIVRESTNSDKVMRQALSYMGEWIDSADESLNVINEKTDKISEIFDGVSSLQGKNTDLETKLDEISEKSERQENKIQEVQNRLNENSQKLDELTQKSDLTSDSLSQKSEGIINKVTEKSDLILSSLTQKFDTANATVQQITDKLPDYERLLNAIVIKTDAQSDDIERIKKTLPEHEALLTNIIEKSDENQTKIMNLILQKMDEQQERMDRIEIRLERIISAIDNIDDTKLTKKVDKIDKQITKFSENIEKLASYVDE